MNNQTLTLNRHQVGQLGMLLRTCIEDLEWDNHVSDWDDSDEQIIEQVLALDGRSGRALYAIAVRDLRKLLGKFDPVLIDPVQ